MYTEHKQPQNEITRGALRLPFHRVVSGCRVGHRQIFLTAFRIHLQAQAALYKTGPCALSRSFLSRMCAEQSRTLRRRLGEVAGTVAEFEFFFAEIGVGDLDGDPAIGAVAALVTR
jgi:hypothetical protein